MTIIRSGKTSLYEIQVRSILEHAWAEIEHSIMYKSGIDFSDEDHRMFAAVLSISFQRCFLIQELMPF
ncbi:MAG: hypothetical protein ACTHLX_15920 [Candidatus Binatia bacterium]